jgi:hypothetical protein
MINDHIIFQSNFFSVLIFFLKSNPPPKKTTRKQRLSLGNTSPLSYISFLYILFHNIKVCRVIATLIWNHGKGRYTQPYSHKQSCLFSSFEHATSRLHGNNHIVAPDLPTPYFFFFTTNGFKILCLLHEISW